MEQVNFGPTVQSMEVHLPGYSLKAPAANMLVQIPEHSVRA